MALRIAYVLIALAGAYLSYNIYEIYSARSNVEKIDPKYAYEPEGADLTVVEFFDYACVHCRSIHPTIMEAVKQDGHVRYIPRGLPNADKDSVNAFIFTHQAAQIGKFLEAHDQIMKNYGPMDEQHLITLSQAADIDLETLNIQVELADIKARLKENYDLFQAFGGKATPTFIIGGTVYVPENGMPSVNDFRDMFDQARSAH